MSAETKGQTLHLPSLSIKEFRGIDDLTIPKLGRVTLIAGKNGVGKTTVLEAVKVYAARGNPTALADILGSREELTDFLDDDGDPDVIPDVEALAYGRNPSEKTCISIGPTTGVPTLSIKFGPRIWQKEPRSFYDYSDEYDGLLIIEFGGQLHKIDGGQLRHSYQLRRFRRRLTDPRFQDAIRCESTGPEVMDNASIARLWDNVALTDAEKNAVQALKLIYGDQVEDRVAMVADEEGRDPRRFNRRAVVRMKGQEGQVPMKSLGDGATRIFGTALGLANSRDGFFLIDEAENGFHYSIQTAFWNMVALAAQANNVQVLATTHSWDCVVGFATAMNELENVEGALVRIDRVGGQLRAVEYSEEDLQVAAHQRIEVR